MTKLMNAVSAARGPAIAMLLAIAFVVSGCSTLAGEKLGMTKEGARIAPTGVPYSLVRAEYTVTRSPPPEGEKRPSYTLGVTYEPDPKQTYSVRLDPALFSDPAFVLKLSASGTVVGTNAQATEQITPTITALGTLIASIASVVRVADSGDTRSSITLALADAAGAGTCGVPTNLTRPPYLAGGEEWATVADAIKSRMNSFGSDEAFVAQFEYLTAQEKACLAFVTSSIKARLADPHARAMTAWTQALAKFKGAQPGDAVFAEQMTKAVGDSDEDAVRKARDAIDNQRKVEVTPLLEARDDLAAAAASAAKPVPSSDVANEVQAFVGMDAPTWIARHVLYLEREGELTSLYLLRNPGLAPAEVAKANEYAAKLRQQRAETLGVAELYRRSEMLSTFLTSIRDRSADGGTAPATSEFATARAELDTVLGQIDARRTRVLADGRPAPPPPITALKATNVKIVTEKGVKERNDAGPPKPDDPAFLVVLKEVE